MPQTIAPPWPPADPTQPLEFDHRGCCGPLDVCGRYRPLELRYEIIGIRSGGPVGVGWLWIATGQLMVADSANWNWYTGRSTGALPATPGENFLNLSPVQDVVPSLAAFVQLSLDATLTTLIQAATANAIGYCPGLITIPVDLAVGPPDPPDRITIRPLRWYQTSSVPWLG